jgi:hypothetical protein
MLQLSRRASQEATEPRRETRRAEGCRRTLRGCLLLLMLWVMVPGIRAAAQSSISPFAGRWDLTLTNSDGSRPSWIDVSDTNGQLKLIFVGLTDHATQLSQAEVRNGELIFVSPKGEEGFSVDTTYSLKRVGDQLTGTVTNSEKKWTVTGKRAPALTDDKVAGWGKPISLFDGHDLKGWKLADPSKPSWKVENGDLVSTGHGSELIGLAKFGNFKIHLEFNTGPQSNSGVYLRGRYEVQIETDSVSEPASHHTGGVYGYLDPTPEQPRIADKWQTFDITLVGRIVTVVQNGITVIDHKEIPGITGGALDSHEGMPGPIYLQGTEKGRVAFRNIVVTPALQ